MGDPISTRGQTLRNKFESEKPRLSYTDYHYEDIKARLNQTRKAGNKDEIVRNMSNLPSFLDTRKDRQDKGLNFGVMDWGKLQKWQFQHLDNCSPCSSSSSPLGSTVRSTPRSTDSQRSYPAGQSPCRMTLQSHFNKLQESESESSVDTFKEKRSSFSAKNSDLGTRGTSPGRRFSFSNAKRTESPITRVSNRSHSSPLKRLFEPLLKATNSHHVTESPREDSKMNANSNLDSGYDMCESTSTKRALFRSDMKNGRVLFTFATENNSNTLAANVRDITGKDNRNRWIYTIYTVDEIKKKSTTWLSNTRKDKDHGYATNVTAQMTVTNHSVYNSDTREFSLFRVDPYDELAAIVVKFPRNMTVILPGGNHGGSRDSKPSSLTDRWWSGGVCDCGGWDLGCRLRTLTNQVQPSERSRSRSRSSSLTGQFELFFQGDMMNKKCLFNIFGMKEGLFSVEYDSSVSCLQAFSICISVVECRKSFAWREPATQQVRNDSKPVRFASCPPLSPIGRV